MEILEKNLIKTLEVFTIMSSDAHISSNGQKLVIKGYSPNHAATLIIKDPRPNFKVRTLATFRSFDGHGILRNYWKAKNDMRLYVSGGELVFENDYGAYSQSIQYANAPPQPIPQSDTWKTVNFQKLRIIMEKSGFARNPKYPRVSTKIVPFNGSDFEGTVMHKTSALYQCLSILWRINKTGRSLVDYGNTFFESKNKKASLYCSISNFLYPYDDNK